jgi:hypothetical protein
MFNKISSAIKTVWGVDTPLRFRVAAWGLAASTFCIWMYYDNRVKQFSEEDAKKWNKKINPMLKD